MLDVSSPVIVAVAESPNRDGEGLPHWVQRVLNHLCLVADGEPASKVTDLRSLKGKHVNSASVVPVMLILCTFISVLQQTALQVVEPF